MTNFLDGPAAGKSLSLRRVPVLLRVVRARNGTWDALDQLDDEPKPTETIHVYYRVGEPIRMHLLIRGKGKKAGGFYESADYRHYPAQPGDAHTRTTEAWQAWCETIRQQVLTGKTLVEAR